MSDFPITRMNAASVVSQLRIPANGKGRRWFEVFLVLLVACGSSLAYSLYLLKNGPAAAPHMSSGGWLMGIMQEVTALLLLGYVLSRRGQGFKDLGLRWSLPDEVRERTGSSALAVALSVAVPFSYHLYYGWAGAISLSLSFLILTLYYARSRRGLSVIVAHGFFDIYGLIRLWAG